MGKFAALLASRRQARAGAKLRTTLRAKLNTLGGSPVSKLVGPRLTKLRLKITPKIPSKMPIDPLSYTDLPDTSPFTGPIDNINKYFDNISRNGEYITLLNSAEDTISKILNTVIHLVNTDDKSVPPSSLNSATLAAILEPMGPDPNENIKNTLQYVYHLIDIDGEAVGGQRGGSIEYDDAVAEANDDSTIFVSGEDGEDYIDAGGDIPSLQKAILTAKVADEVHKYLMTNLAGVPDDDRDKEIIVGKITEQKRKYTKRIKQEFKVIGERKRRAAAMPVLIAREVAAAAREADARERIAQRERDAAAAVAAEQRKAELLELSTKSLDQIINELDPDNICSRVFEMGHGTESKESEGARSVLTKFDSTGTVLNALYVKKDEFTTPFMCYICGTECTQILLTKKAKKLRDRIDRDPNGFEAAAKARRDLLAARRRGRNPARAAEPLQDTPGAQFEHVFDLFSALSKKLVPIPGQNPFERRAQRCLGEWACPYCNGSAKSNKDLTNNSSGRLDRADWNVPGFTYGPDIAAIEAMLGDIWDYYKSTSKLRIKYADKATFIRERTRIIAWRIQISCETTTKFVDWNKYQLTKKFIRAAINKWIGLGKPPIVAGQTHILPAMLTTFLNNPDYNPLNLTELRLPKYAILDYNVMFYNFPGDARTQSTARGLHPDMGNIHGNAVLAALTAPAAGGRRKQKRYTVSKKYRARSTRRIR
jgi:hypothetical protein